MMYLQCKQKLESGQTGKQAPKSKFYSVRKSKDTAKNAIFWLSETHSHLPSLLGILSTITRKMSRISNTK